MKFKVGDLVKIKDGLEEGEKYGGLTLYGPRMNFKGQKRIEGISGQQKQFYEIGCFSYTQEMLEKVEDRRSGMRFKVGDKVRVREWDDMEREFDLDNEGDIDCPHSFVKEMKKFCGKTCEISKVADSYYRFKEDGEFWNFTDEMLIPVEFTKGDMKNGMLLETREGVRFLWESDKAINLDGHIAFMRNDLKNESDKSFDIVKAGYPNKKAKTIKEMLGMDFSEIIWERQEQPTTKDVSLDEINALLKEKYPTIQHFNLPIKE